MYSISMLTNMPICVNYFLCVPIPCEQAHLTIPILCKRRGLLEPILSMYSNSLWTTCPFNNDFVCIPIPGKQIGPIESITSRVLQFLDNKLAHLNQLLRMHSNFMQTNSTYWLSYYYCIAILMMLQWIYISTLLYYLYLINIFYFIGQPVKKKHCQSQAR